MSMLEARARVVVAMQIIADQMDVIAKAMEQVEDEVRSLEFRQAQVEQRAASHPSNWDRMAWIRTGRPAFVDLGAEVSEDQFAMAKALYSGDPEL